MTHVDVSSFASKTNLASLKTEIDKLNIDKSTQVPSDLAKLSNVVKNSVVKKTECNKLVGKVDNIDTTNFVLRTKYEKDGADLEKKLSDVDKKIPDVSNLVKKTDLNAKITEVEGKIPSISGLATNSALTAVENKIPDVSGLVKKTDFTTKVTEIEGKISSISSLATNSALTVVENKTPNVSSLVKKANLDTELKKIRERVTSNKTRHFQIESKLKKLEKFDSSYFKGKCHFEEDVTQNYLVFQPIYRYFRKIVGVGSGNYIYFWKSIVLSHKGLNSNTASNYTITPELSFYGTKTRVEFNGSCLKQDKVTYSHGTIVNIYIVYEISKNYNISTYPKLENSLFGAVSLTENADIDQYKYSRYGIGFDRKREFSFRNGFGRNCIILVAYMSSSSHTNNKKNNILVLGRDFVQGINGTTIYAEK